MELKILCISHTSDNGTKSTHVITMNQELVMRRNKSHQWQFCLRWNLVTNPRIPQPWARMWHQSLRLLSLLVLCNLVQYIVSSYFHLLVCNDMKHTCGIIGNSSCTVLGLAVNTPWLRTSHCRTIFKFLKTAKQTKNLKVLKKLDLNACETCFFKFSFQVWSDNHSGWTTNCISFTQSTRQQNLQKIIIYDYKEATHLMNKEMFHIQNRGLINPFTSCLKPTTSNDKLTITQVPSILFLLFTFFHFSYSTRTDSRGTVFSHTKFFVFSSLSNAFVTDRSEVGNKKDEKH